MPKARSQESYTAEQLFKEGKKLTEIASQLNISEGTVRSWKNRYKWDSNSTATLQKNKRNVAKRKRGGQPGNTNGTGPPGNNNAEKHGLFSKHLPEETFSIIQSMPTDPLDILWDQIQIAYAAIIRAQQIMYVTDRDDVTTTKVAESCGDTMSEKWEVQQAWDKQATFLQAQARAQKTLEGMISRYEELLHKNWDLATEEQKARISQMQANTERLKKDAGDLDDDDGVVIENDV